MSAAQKVRVLFLCTGNSCRSQIAEAWARRLKSDVIEAHSAGIAPHGIDPRAVSVMSEVGVDISNQRSKDVLELMDDAFDYVVTMCGGARETCPVFPGQVKRVHVGFDDPPTLARDEASNDEALEIYRRVRDEIRAFIDTLPGALEELVREQG